MELVAEVKTLEDEVEGTDTDDEEDVEEELGAAVDDMAVEVIGRDTDVTVDAVLDLLVRAT